MSPQRPIFSSPNTMPTGNLGPPANIQQSPSMATAVPPMMHLQNLPPGNFSIPPPSTNIALQSMPQTSQMPAIPGLGTGIIPGTTTQGIPGTPTLSGYQYPPTPPNPYSPYSMAPQGFPQIASQSFPGLPVPQSYQSIPTQQFPTVPMGMTPLSMPSTVTEVKSSMEIAHQQISMDTGSGYMSQMDINLANAIGMTTQQATKVTTWIYFLSFKAFSCG